MKSLRIGILDMYMGVANEGMRCIKNSISHFGLIKSIESTYETFDVRNNSQMPQIADFDAFICSGGPGSPLLEGYAWENIFFNFIQELEKHNGESVEQKPLFAICHSFQLLFQYYKLGKITKRKSTAFGVMPVDMTNEGRNEMFFYGLEDPFWVVDSRDYQAINPNMSVFEKLGAEVLCIEKDRPHVNFERAIMAIRFNRFMIGTQFHPEADGEGMHRLFLVDDKKAAVIANHGEEKYYNMLDFLDDPEKIEKTESIVLPAFYAFALENKYQLQEN
jgi:homoserine O-succinyltransferase/O-acetyltransferase